MNPVNQPTDDQPLDDALLRQLSDYVDETLSPEAAASLEVKLAADPGLQKELDALTATDRIVRSSQAPMPDIDWAAFTESLHRKRTAQDRQRPPRSTIPFARYLRPLAAAAVLMFAVTGILIIQSPDRNEQTGSPRSFVEISVHRPAQPSSDSAARRTAAVTLVRERDSGSFMDPGFDFVGPPYRAHSLLVVTGMN